MMRTHARNTTDGHLDEFPLFFFYERQRLRGACAPQGLPFVRSQMIENE
jgi:hypothetical protein